MYAYSEMYLDDAMENLGEAMDVAVNDCHMDADEFMDLFVTGGLAEAFGNGTPKYVSGMSGAELVLEVFKRAGITYNKPFRKVVYDCSPEYWSGWILAYYQWSTRKNFRNIHQTLPMREILKLYPTLHEAPEEKFIDVANVIIEKSQPDTQLGFYRRMRGYSQRILAEKSGVSLRMIQQYEQKVKDIDKASVSSIQALAKVLNCSIEDLIS